MAGSIHILLLSLVWLAVITSIVLWARFLYRVASGQKRFEDLVPLEGRRPPFWTFAEFLLCFGAFWVALILCATWFTEQGWIERAAADTPAGQGPSLQSLIMGIAINSLAGILAVSLTLGWISLLHGNAIKNLGLIPKRSDIALGLRASLWLLPPVGLISLVVSLLVPYEHPVLNMLSESPTLPLFAGMFVGTVLVAPFVEEFMFRVLLQGSLQGIASSTKISTTNTNDGQGADRPARVSAATSELADAYRPPSTEALGTEGDLAESTQECWAPVSYWPIVVTSVVFSLMHLGQGAAPIPLFALSLGLGYLYRQTGRITAPLLVHMVLNAVTMCVEFTRFVAESSG